MLKGLAHSGEDQKAASCIPQKVPQQHCGIQMFGQAGVILRNDGEEQKAALAPSCQAQHIGVLFTLRVWKGMEGMCGAEPAHAAVLAGCW